MSRVSLTTWVAISRSALRHNVRVFRRLLSVQTQLMAVVKSNAYGHGLIETSRIVRAAGVRWLGVVSLDEALALRQARVGGRILVLSFFHPDRLAEAIRQNIRLTVYSAAAAHDIDRVAARLGKKATLHVKIDTGTTRLGIMPHRAVADIKKIAALRHCRLEGIFTHFADAENPNQRMTNKQQNVFESILAMLKDVGIHIPVAHLACSAAAILNPRTHADLARIGISLYGLWSVENGQALRRRLNLKPVLSWHTRIIQVKTVPTGARIGYGQTYRVKQTARIAVLPVGYWDGYDRRLSNKASVIIHGHRCPVRGRICMNLMMVDVSRLPRVRTGDSATLIGYTGRASVTADELADIMGTINYEVVTRINPLLPRIITS